MKNQVIKIPIGEYQEGMSWEIHTNYTTGASYIKVCKHAISLPAETITNIHTGQVFNHPSVMIPVVIMGINEGGYNCTTICWDCIKDAMKEYKIA